MARFDNANIMLYCKFYYYYYIEFECVFLLYLEWDVMHWDNITGKTIDNDVSFDARALHCALRHCYIFKLMILNG
jgi:hypothetical protein